MSDIPAKFTEVGERFLGQKLGRVQRVAGEQWNAADGRLTPKTREEKRRRRPVAIQHDPAPRASWPPGGLCAGQPVSRRLTRETGRGPARHAGGLPGAERIRTGIAAPQIGSAQRVVFLNVGTELPLINLKIRTPEPDPDDPLGRLLQLPGPDREGPPPSPRRSGLPGPAGRPHSLRAEGVASELLQPRDRPPGRDPGDRPRHRFAAHRLSPGTPPEGEGPGRDRPLNSPGYLAHRWHQN
ncbi:MAG: hypothetical protein MZV64_29530 [Ignavibacteriales bacterium]|nr:hypothetical protein [Ignavibacteriales bacterium]